jgi:hypothetical protein
MRFSTTIVVLTAGLVAAAPATDISAKGVVEKRVSNLRSLLRLSLIIYLFYRDTQLFSAGVYALQRLKIQPRMPLALRLV